jgi:Polysaccharide pyruvyl transferase
MAKRVGILTFHHVLNYGGMLQAWSLTNAVASLGHVVQVIDYRPAVARRQYAHYGLRSGTVCQMIAKHMRFRQFMTKHIPLTQIRYKAADHLYKNPPPFDVLMTGSDQVWNINSFRGFDPPFFLHFADRAGARRVSYAPSFGDTVDLGQHREAVATLLGQFDRLSVRDRHSHGLVRELCGRDAIEVMDPVFLSDLRSMVKPIRRPSRYLLGYWIKKTPEFVSTVQQLARRWRLTVVSVGQAFPGADLNVIGADPGQWLDLFLHAALICTNSFHGVAVSICFHKDFLVVPGSNDTRLGDLLTKVGLQHRLARDASDAEWLPVDYAICSRLIEEQVLKSRAFLREAIDGRGK